jgi:hypothetical protein
MNIHCYASYKSVAATTHSFIEIFKPTDCQKLLEFNPAVEEQLNKLDFILNESLLHNSFKIHFLLSKMKSAVKAIEVFSFFKVVQ